jgi:aminoglycoside phosphotransferase family enzyme
MQVENQDAVSAFLAEPGTHAGAGAVEVLHTHVSSVFLAGDRALKLKRAVRLPYADFSTPAIRLAACEKEYALNAAISPELYLGVRRITQAEDGGLAFDGPGALVDAVVEMRRFDPDSRLDLMARRGALTAEIVVALADRIVAAQAAAEVAQGADGAGNIAAVLDVNRAGFAESDVFSDRETAALDDAFRAALDAHAARLDARARAGQVRRCHGDLHLRNVCLHDGRPTLFDCLDFNDSLATVDVLYDLAFMAMDLWHSGLPAFANLLTNRYLDVAEQEDGVPLLPFFTALRAAVRAHVTATQSMTAAPEEREGLRAGARAYRDLAQAILAPRRPRLVALGGFSGSGKSTVAEGLAPGIGAPPGARILESDRLRKALFGVTPEARLPEAAYAPEVSEKVYRTLAERAASLVAEGASVVACAVFDRPARRAAMAEAARAAGAPFTGLWLEADPEVLRRRVTLRAPGASDADADVLAMQLRRDPGRIDWAELSTARPLDDTLAEARDRIGPDEGAPP